MARRREAAKRERRQKSLVYGSLLAELTRALHVADPIGIGASPLDEYEPEAELVLAGLRQCRDVHDVQSLLHRVFVQMFDADLAGPPSAYRQLSVFTWARWQRTAGVTSNQVW